MSDKGVTLPTWFLGALATALVTLAICASGALITTWAKADAAAQKNMEQDTRIGRLEAAQVDIASMRSQLASTHELAKSTNEKLDRIIFAELGKRK